MINVNAEAQPNINRPYYYLWHLAALRVIDIDLQQNTRESNSSENEESVNEVCPRITNTLWDRINTYNSTISSAKIAMIDVGTSLEHPNLKSRVSMDESIDLAAHPYGAKFEKQPDKDIGSMSEEKSTNNFSDLNSSDFNLHGLSREDRAFFNAFVTDLCESKGVRRRYGNINERFASHGTSMAGLMVGGPALEHSQTTPISDQVLPYFGVDPFSKLISIRTSFDDDPFQFIAAFLYAWMHQADVIVMPRGLPDPKRGPLSAKKDLLASLEEWKNRDQTDLYDRLDKLGVKPSLSGPEEPYSSLTSTRAWGILRELIIEISKSIPVVCAAGNDGESQLIYPSNLADRDNGIIAVGAVSAEGYRSSYSNYGDGLTVVAPSDDMEVLTRHQARIDWSSPYARQGQIPVPSSAMKIPLSSLGLLSTDVPGQYGYDGDTAGGSLSTEDAYIDEDEPGESGYYTIFGGTSGAAALVGGVVALARRAELARNPSGDNKRDGVAMKKLLESKACISASVFPGGRPMSTDRMNAADEDVHTAKYFFGAGLVDARAVVEAVLPEIFYS